MKLYTKRGDDGDTDLFGGKRVGKDSLRMDAIGSVDEINCAIGVAAAVCRVEEIAKVMRVLQDRLFELGADLATPLTDKKTPKHIKRIGAKEIREAERMIDAACAPLPPMRYFVLPGGTELAARLHAVRAVCRRAERLCVKLAREERVNRHALVYLNRLSDLVFALARRANQVEGIEDIPWKS